MHFAFAVLGAKNLQRKDLFRKFKALLLLLLLYHHLSLYIFSPTATRSLSKLIETEKNMNNFGDFDVNSESSMKFAEGCQFHINIFKLILSTCSLTQNGIKSFNYFIYFILFLLPSKNLLKDRVLMFSSCVTFRKMLITLL